MPNNSTKNQTLLGFDFGLKRIGVAVGQTITGTATPLTTLQAKNGVPNWNQIEQLIQHWKPNGLVVGIPLNMLGKDQSLIKEAKNFAKLLERFELPVYEIDERLTTKEARQQVFDVGGYKALQETEIDSIAAKLILESWFGSSSR
jgi:putative Holliday junction resolvase